MNNEIYLDSMLRQAGMIFLGMWFFVFAILGYSDEFFRGFCWVGVIVTLSLLFVLTIWELNEELKDYE